MPLTTIEQTIQNEYDKLQSSKTPENTDKFLKLINQNINKLNNIEIIHLLIEYLKEKIVFSNEEDSKGKTVTPSKDTEKYLDTYKKFEQKLETKLAETNKQLLQTCKKEYETKLETINQSYQDNDAMFLRVKDKCMFEYEQQLIQPLIHNQLIQDLENLKFFIKTLPTYDFFKAQAIYKLIKKRFEEFPDKMTVAERLHKEQKLIKSIASLTNAYKQNEAKATRAFVQLPKDFNKLITELQNSSINDTNFRDKFNNTVYILEKTIEKFDEEGFGH